MILSMPGEQPPHLPPVAGRRLITSPPCGPTVPLKPDPGPVGEKLRITVHNGERLACRVVVWALENVLCFGCKEGFVKLRRRNPRICAVKLCDGRWRRRGLRIRGGNQTEKSDDPQPSNVLSHVLAFRIPALRACEEI